MLIIAGYLMLDPSQRDAFVEAHQDLVRRGRQAPGCLDLAITADSLEPGRVNNYERWESEDALDAWREIAKAPDRAGVEVLDGDVASDGLLDALTAGVGLGARLPRRCPSSTDESAAPAES